MTYHSLKRFVAALPAIVLAAPSCNPARHSDDNKTYVVPSSIPADCSRDVEADISDYIAHVPNGSRVRFGRGGCYAQSASIVVSGRSDLTIEGAGSTFRSSAPNDGRMNPNWVIQTGRNVTLQNLIVQGNFKSTAPRGIQPGNQFNAGVIVKGGVAVSLVDLTTRDVWGDGVTVGRGGLMPGDSTSGEVARDVHVVRLKASRSARMCVGPTEAIGFWLEDSSCVNSYYGGVDAEIDVPGQHVKDYHILRNTFDGYYTSAITVPQKGRTGDVDGVEIRGNRTLTPPDTCFPTILMTYTEGPIPYDPAQTMANIVTEDNDLKTLGDGVRYRDVSSGSIRSNRVIRSVSTRYCGSPDAPTPSDPAEDVRLINSPTVTVRNNGAATVPSTGRPPRGQRVPG